MTPTLGPDATGVGWVFEYTLTSDKHSLQELRSIQDWYLKYGLTAVEGVAEVASIGGFVKEYQITVDPVKLMAFNIPISMVEMAVKNSNNDVGGEVIEMGEMEFMVRGLGYIKSIDDIKHIPIMTDPKRGTPVYLSAILPTSASGRSCAGAWRRATAKARSWAASSSCATARTRWKSSPRSRRN